MDDIILAIEAERRGLPRIALRRSAGWLPRHPKPQIESLWEQAVQNDATQTSLLAKLVLLKQRNHCGERKPVSLPARNTRGPFL